MQTISRFIKHSHDKSELRTVMQADEQLKKMDRRDIELINAVTGSNIKIPEGKETVNMCKAIEEMLAESRMQGISLGISLGIRLAISQGQVRFALNVLRRYERRNIPITAEVLADIAEDMEMPIEKVRDLAVEKGISIM